MSTDGILLYSDKREKHCKECKKQTSHVYQYTLEAPNKRIIVAEWCETCDGEDGNKRAFDPNKDHYAKHMCCERCGAATLEPIMISCCESVGNKCTTCGEERTIWSHPPIT